MPEKCSRENDGSIIAYEALFRGLRCMFIVNHDLCTDLKPLDASRTGSRLPDSPAPPISQQDIKIKQEPKTPITPKKTQVCMSV